MIRERIGEFTGWFKGIPEKASDWDWKWLSNYGQKVNDDEAYVLHGLVRLEVGAAEGDGERVLQKTRVFW